MKKLLCSVVIIGLALFEVFAGPFGLEWGMSLNDVKAKGEILTELEATYSSRAFSYLPNKRHSSFVEYEIELGYEEGLMRVAAGSSAIKSNKYGTEVKAAFESISASLSKVYGEPIEEIEEVDKESFWVKDSPDWMMSLYEGSRQIMTIWGNEDTAVVLSIEPITIQSARLILLYESPQYYHYLNRIESAENSVF